MLGQQDDLPRMVGVVGELSVDGLHDGMGLATDVHRPTQVAVSQGLDRREDGAPAVLPHRRDRLAGTGRAHELRVAIPVWLLPVGGEKVRPSRPHVARHVLDDDGNGVHLAVQHLHQLGIRHLRHRALGQLLVEAEQRQ